MKSHNTQHLSLASLSSLLFAMDYVYLFSPPPLSQNSYILKIKKRRENCNTHPKQVRMNNEHWCIFFNSKIKRNNNKPIESHDDKETSKPNYTKTFAWPTIIDLHGMKELPIRSRQHKQPHEIQTLCPKTTPGGTRGAKEKTKLLL